MLRWKTRKFSNKLNLLKTKPHSPEDPNPPSEIKHSPQIACYMSRGFSSSKRKLSFLFAKNFCISLSDISKGEIYLRTRRNFEDCAC